MIPNAMPPFDFGLGETADALRDQVQRFASTEVAPIAAEIDETDRFPEELLPIFGDMGLMQMWVPEEYGGPNGNLTMMCMAREEISRVSPACGSLAGLNTMFIPSTTISKYLGSTVVYCFSKKRLGNTSPLISFTKWGEI